MKKILLLFLSILSLNVIGQTSEYDSLYRLDKDTIVLDEVIIGDVQPYQATYLMPITFKNINRNVISFNNYGQEPSRILSTTPSITTYSENGGDFGYSYIRLRGVDQTRINVTLNGVPMNEPEDQGCYFSNYPDFLQSVELIQVQRGTGMTKTGSASYAGSMNFESINTDKSEIELNLGYGSWHSSRIGIKARNNWKSGGIYFSLSNISSDGYKEHSKNESNSLFLVINQKYKNNDFKLVGIVGGQNNQLAWLGSPSDSINVNRKHNACTTREIDNFKQYHIQFHHKYTINEKTYFNYYIFYNYLKGSYTYDAMRFGVDELYGYYLKSNWIGLYWNYYFKINNNIQIYTGVNGYSYEREHKGTTNDVDTYTNAGGRFDLSYYLKTIISIDNISAYADYQIRYTDFAYKEDRTTYFAPLYKYIFNNFTLGSDYKLNNNVFYYSVGQTHREPTRNDMFQGQDDIQKDSVLSLKPESVVDQELGYRFINNKIFINANLFYMIFKNELVLTGETGPTALLLHDNVNKSFRRGCEVDFKYKLKNFTFSQNGSYNDSKIIIDSLKITSVLTPKFLSNTSLIYENKIFKSGISMRYQSLSYIDLSNNHSISDFYTLNLTLGLKWKWGEWNLFLNNITNQKYFTSGMMDGDQDLYFVEAPFNFYTTIKFNF